MIFQSWHKAVVCSHACRKYFFSQSNTTPQTFLSFLHIHSNCTLCAFSVLLVTELLCVYGSKEDCGHENRFCGKF